MPKAKKYYYPEPSVRTDRSTRAGRAIAIYHRSPWMSSTEIAQIVGMSATHVRKVLRGQVKRSTGGPGVTEISFTREEMERLDRWLEARGEAVEPGDLGFEEERR